MKGPVPDCVVVMNVTDCPASIVFVAGERVTVGVEFTVITELEECTIEPTLSVTVSRTLYVPAAANVIVLAVLETPAVGFVVYV